MQDPMYDKLRELTAGFEGESLEEKINKLCDTRQDIPDWEEKKQMLRNELQPKYVIVKRYGRYEFRAGYVEMHRDLLDESEIRNRTCVGGGFWGVDGDNRRVTLYDSSSDFGRPKNIEEAIRQDGLHLLEILGSKCDRSSERHDLSGYDITYIDAIGRRHTVKPLSNLIEPPADNEETMKRLETYARYDGGERHKHYSDDRPKDYAKKKKAKRRQQKQARRRNIT